MSKIVCVTNRNLCQDNFLKQIEKIAKCNPHMIVLREKDLSEEDYKVLAINVIKICDVYGCQCVLHNFANVAIELGHKAIHMPLGMLEKLTEKEREYFEILGCSCHSLKEAQRAQELGCTYIFAGHIFDTDCKKGLKGRGITFLKDICENTNIKVYGIGGIDASKLKEVISAGAEGGAVMSGFMKSNNIERMFREYEL